MTTPHDTALEAAQAMAFGLAKLRYNESDKDASDLATQHTITAYLAALPVDVNDTYVVEIQPMSDEERAALVDGAGDAIYDAKDIYAEEQSYSFAAAALAHLEANYHLVKKDK